MRILVLILIFLIPITPVFSKNKSDTKKEKKILEKSLLYPGWGQIIEKEYVKGIGFVLAETTLILSAIVMNNKSNDYYDKYKIAENVDDVIFYRQKTEEFDKKRNILILSAAFVWVVNLVDIYIHVKKKRRRLKLSFEKRNEEYFCINFTYSF